MSSLELEKSKIHVVVEIVQYLPHAIVSKTIVKKITGNIVASSFDAGEEQGEIITPYDNFIQIIDGNAQVLLKDKVFQLTIGEGMVIPAHVNHSFKAKEPFKMISTMIKSGLDDKIVV